MKRRKFIKNTLLAGLGIGLVNGLYAWQVEPFCLEFVSMQMPLAHLPEKLVGKTLMQISDMHVGNRFDYQYIIDSFKKAQIFQPDMVVYTGDYVTYENTQQFQQLAEVLEHAVKGKITTLAILGNHDYGKNWREQKVADTITHLLENAGISVLQNEVVDVEGLKITGFDDFWGRNFNPRTALQNYDDTKANIVLCHNPDVCDLDVWQHFQGWILSGHTHGGQFKPPFLPPPVLPVKNRRYTAGKFDLIDERTLYINRALGHSWQMRWNVRPEITLFTLAKKA
ncbi:MAG: metallophosphoesterase [Chitinophagales bacterium]|nr:metallophosphoesterase [Bacteroidota bacterium]MCB9043820.1 metallophosphoesterase [Chitinophagales bacterium]